MSTLLKLAQVTKYRPDHPDVPLFSGIDGRIEEGERVVLLGASGQGKSTLLRIIARLAPMDQGALTLAGQAQAQWQARDWRKQVCYVAQQAVMLPGTVGDNLRTVSRLHGNPFEEKLAQELMEAAGLAAIAWSRQAAELSGGEKQRLALLRSLLLHPKLLLLDEVTASLDPSSKQAIEELLLAWSSREQTACLWVTHDVAQAARVSQTVWFMAEGRLLETGEARSFFQAPQTEEARRFLHREDGEGGEAHE